MPVARAVTARNWPPGASSTIVRESGSRRCCGWAQLRIDVRLAGVISRASVLVRRSIRGGRRRRSTSLNSLSSKPPARRPATSHLPRLNVRTRRSADPAERSRYQKQWFQVTRRSTRSPTGMHGQNMAFGMSGRWPFAPRRRISPAADQYSGARPLFPFR
jgi:hypothetical protein